MSIIESMVKPYFYYTEKWGSLAMNNLIKERTIIDDFKISSEERLEVAKIIAKNFKPDLKTICEVDLHCHSFYSDGYYSPTNKVFEAYSIKTELRNKENV